MKPMVVGLNLDLLKDNECGSPIFGMVWRHKLRIINLRNLRT